MTTLRTELLGPFSVTLDGDPLPLPTRKTQALLAFLAVSPGQLYTRERLAALLWGSSAGEQARQSLRQTLFAVRRVVHGVDVFITDGDRVGLNESLVSTDLHDLRKALESGDLHQARALYRGDFLDGFTVDEELFDNWASTEREAIRERTIHAFERLLERYTDLEHAIESALHLISIQPHRESLHRSLMRLYLREGRRDAVIRQYYTLSDALRKRLSIEPDEETKRVFREALALSPGTPEPQVHEPAILVIEDNALNRELMRAMLKETGYHLTLAADGGEALIELGKRHFDLVIVDLGLPTVDGLTFIKVLRQNGYATPVIVLTAYQDEAHETQAIELGAADYLRKPIPKQTLLERIGEVIGRFTSATARRQ